MRIGLIGDNSLEFVQLLMNIWEKGDCAVIIDWRTPPKSISKLCEEADIAYCYIEESLMNKNGAYLHLSLKCISYRREKVGIAQVPPSMMLKYSPNNTETEALILYSSGTTGKKKGIILTHRAINKNADAIVKYMKLTTRDSMLIVKTLTHASTIVGELLVAFKTRCTLYISSTITPLRYTLGNINKYSITTLCVNPSLLEAYICAAKRYKIEFLKLKVMYTSGSLINKDKIIEAKQCFGNIPILNVYGLTEAGPRVTAQRLDDLDGYGSVGKPIEGVQIKLVKLKKLGNDAQGIVFVKSSMLFSGYVSGERTNVDAEGWLDTGDVGFIDSFGNLYIVGRYDNMMSIGSHNVFPEEIEKRIMESGLVNECVVYSVKNSLQGEEIVCEYIADKEKDKELIQYCSQYLAIYEIPKRYIKVEKLQYTYNGKKRRRYNGN